MTSPLTAGSPAIAGDMTAALEQLVQDELDALTWSDWTPTLTNLTQGSGTLVARYIQVGTTVHFHFRFTYGSGSAVGSNPTFTLPVAPAASPTYPASYFPAVVRMLDSGTTARQGELTLTSGSTVQLWYWNATPATAALSSTAPWTWTTNDEIVAAGTYEAAAA